MQRNRLQTEIIPAPGGLERAQRGGFVPSRLARTCGGNAFWNEAHQAFHGLVMQQQFPCVGARAACNAEAYVLAVYDLLSSEKTTVALARDLYEFTHSELRGDSDYATFVAVFQNAEAPDEAQFENKMWQQLTELNRIDAAHFEWDPGVRSDPADPKFSFSFGGQALYVIGMHPNSSRIARRFNWPAMIFNPHEQFERLRADGKWKQMQQTIRERDVHLQGSVNPMLSDFGQASEARQYSGRAVEEDWKAPFEAAQPSATGKCPFGH